MRDKLIFGHSAMKHWFPDCRKSISGDIDYISKEKIDIPKTESHHFGPSFDWILENNKDDTYVDANFLANIKYAHLGWLNHWWDKTCGDVVFFQRKGIELDPFLYKMLVADFKVAYGKKWAPMKGKDSKSFFEDKVQRKYVHDSIHQIISYYDEPLYHRILKYPETESVECDKEKFDKLDFEDKLKLVREEIYVTALERWLIPEDFKYSRHRAYYGALKKLTTTMSGGWFKQFIITNFKHLAINTDWDFINKFKKGVENGQVKENN